MNKKIFRTLVIIPAYNEEGSIGSVIESLRHSGVEFLVVNDGSKDGTLALLKELNVNFLDLPVNIGLHGAVQAGLIYASVKKYDCAIQFDGDGQHRPEYLPVLMRAIEGNECDVAIGSRFVNTKRPASMRMLGSRLISSAIYLLTKKFVSDPTSGMRAYSQSVIDLMAANPNYGPEPDTIAYLIRTGREIKEFHVDMSERTAGVSYLGFTSSIKYMIRMMVSILLIQPFR